MLRLLAILLFSLLASCTARPPESVYYWKTVLDWKPADSKKIGAAGVDTLGLRLFDWGVRGAEGPLVVRGALPAELAVVPVVYVTTAKLEAWAADSSLDPQREASELWEEMQPVLARAWPGTPAVWQLDADWTASTRNAWFSVAAAFRDLVHSRGARFEVTIRLHQYRDRAQGIPPADAGVLMLYGAGEAVLDKALVSGYLKGPSYPLPLTPAFPAYAQVRQLNGYGRLVALHRLKDDADLPTGDLKALGPDSFEVTRRSQLGGRPLLEHDVLLIDRVSPETLAAVARLPGVQALRHASGGRVWFFDYGGDNVPRLE